MKILITGGAGYIGSVLVPALLAQGHYVHVIDNLMYGQTSLAACCSDKMFDFTRGDSRDYRLVSSLVGKADCVIPLAALVGMPICDVRRDDAFSTNFHAIETLSRMMHQDQLLVYPNTTSGYGSTNGEAVTEDSLMSPISHYGRTKCRAEREVVESNSRWTVLRLATVFGASPRMRIDLLVNDFVLRAVTDHCLTLFEADFMRGFVHVNDVVSAFSRVLTGYLKEREIYNIGAVDMSKKQLCDHIQKNVENFTYNVNEIGEDPDKRNYRVSYIKARDAGWRPRTTISDGIEELITLYKMSPKHAWRNV